MAKKKKQIKSKKLPVNNDKSSFWSLTGALLLCVLGLFVLLGGFNNGGVLPKDLFHGTYWVLGWAAYITPLALAYWGVNKFLTEDHRIPLSKLISMLGVLLFSASWLFTLTAVKNANQTWISNHGGKIGTIFGSAALLVVDKIPASFVFFVFAALSVFFSFGISPRVILKIGSLFKTKDDENGDTDLAKLKAQSTFKLNEGVPVEHISGRARLQQGLKTAAEKAGSNENHEALTLASDPDWKFPPITLLNQKQDKADAGDVEHNARNIKETLANFNIDVEMEGANVGPRVTQYTLRPPTGVKLTRITALENNLALDLAAQSIRIEAPIPGKRAVGIEVPNVKSAMVRISSILQSGEWQGVSSPLGFVIGRDIAGVPIVRDLATMPHLLVAGQTGSGKSVMINSILTSLLFHNSPSELKLILVDPKQVELTPYNGIPHLLTPVINEPEKCLSALKWAVAEMERRLKAMAELGKRNIAEYNALKKEAGMPYIVIVIDELADLMVLAGRDVETLIVRVAQKARAVGIHLVLATQRPSVNVITGLIKANIPARMAFTTASQIDSRTIIDQMGAEKLLGQGDMLLLTSEMPKPKRVQAAFISVEETNKITDFIRMQRPPQYDSEVISQPVQLNGRGGVVVDYGDDTNDELWKDAVQVVINGKKASTSLLQRRLRIGYGRAARLIETMEEQGIVGPSDGARPRDVLVSSLDEVMGNNTENEESFPEPETEEESV
jgi:S-DNA-T family DNA segregation ATPase FtsK/SpoIIIE